MSEHSIVMSLHTEIEKITSRCEEVCFDTKSTEEATQVARIRRQQLIDVRDFLQGKKAHLDL